MGNDLYYGYGYLQPNHVDRSGYFSNIFSSILQVPAMSDTIIKFLGIYYIEFPLQIPIQTLMAVSHLVQGILATKYGAHEHAAYAPSYWNNQLGYGGLGLLPLQQSPNVNADNNQQIT